jgi:hypothetical protein
VLKTKTNLYFSECGRGYHTSKSLALWQTSRKNLTLSASANEIESYWLLPPFMQTTDHEDQDMICDTACPAMVSKFLKAFNTVNLLTEMQMLSE